MTIGQNIKAYRLQKGFTQADLARLINVTRQAVSKWECDEVMPDTENLIQLSKILNVSADKLLNINQETNMPLDNSNFNIQVPKKQKRYMILTVIFIITAILFGIFFVIQIINKRLLT